MVKRGKPEMPVVLTIGHSTRTWPEFLKLLRAHHVHRVVDVRSIPRSRHNPQFEPANPPEKAAGGEDKLRSLAKAGRPAPCAARFPEYGLAQYFVSRICRLHADPGFRRGLAAIDRAGAKEKERIDVRRGGAVALPSFPHRRRAGSAQIPRRRHCAAQAVRGPTLSPLLRVCAAGASPIHPATRPLSFFLAAHPHRCAGQIRSSLSPPA